MDAPSKACDQCRRDKKKCREDFTDDKSTDRCARCKEKDFDCTWLRVVKKRGPDKGYSYEGRLSRQLNRGRRTASAQASASHGIIPSTSSSGLGVDPVADLRGIDRYMPRKLALDLQHIYIDYLWQLVPLLHPPTHLEALDAGFDQESSEFLTVVLAIATYTTALAPNSWIDVPPTDLYGFLVGCIDALQTRIKDMVAEGLSFPCLVSQYLLVAALDSLDLHDQSMLAWAQVVQMTTMLRLFEEDHYFGLDTLDREIHLRMFWLVFGGDKSHSCSFTHPPALRSVDFGPMTHVQPLLDEYVSAPSSLSRVPRSEVILGFRYVSILFEILEKAEILYHAGRFRLEWDQVRATLARFDEINVENDNALIGCERPFQLDPGDQLASDLQANADSWVSAETAASSHGRWERPDPYVVAKANIYMTQLITKCYVSKAKQVIIDRSGYPFAPDHDHARLTRSLCEELLLILRCWPPQAVAVNGRTVLGKVRWIASHRLEENLEDLDEHDQQVLLDMLTVFGDIESRSLVTPVRVT